MLLGRIFGVKDFPKITKKLSKSIIKQRWTFILGFVNYTSALTNHISVLSKFKNVFFL
jgi:hypothetical protein